MEEVKVWSCKLNDRRKQRFVSLSKEEICSLSEDGKAEEGILYLPEGFKVSSAVNLYSSDHKSLKNKFYTSYDAVLNALALVDSEMVGLYGGYLAQLYRVT